MITMHMVRGDARNRVWRMKFPIARRVTQIDEGRAQPIAIRREIDLRAIGPQEIEFPEEANEEGPSPSVVS